MIVALLLTLWAIFCVYDVLGPTLIYAQRALIAGTVAGLIVGNLTLGMAIGGTLELASLGVYTYGGATIPDYTTGAIIGTALATVASGDFTHQLAIGIGLGIPAALLLTALDPIGRFLPTFWIHAADRAAADGRTRALTALHWTAFIPWAAVRAIPTFLAAYFLNSNAVTSIEKAIPAWLVNGLGLVGAILPAVGFALLLRLLPVGKYWYMLLIGYVLYAYMHVTLVGIALFGLAVAFIFVTLKPTDPIAGATPSPAPPPPAPTDDESSDPPESVASEQVPTGAPAEEASDV
ncbi:MAG TPA: PTS sugar transporter subunit IIC [Pseudonocardiaceae bacterium]|jgi:mannose/fructose/N-acetylgalactosamine-specific phosphotransferase system component IIC|nr:PTS sugar transporter subunit IIC [Pseudonocardiaceae bacterium]